MAISLDQLPYDPATVLPLGLHELTQSALATGLACPQKFVFRYLMRLVPQGISGHLVCGQAVHSAMESLLDPANRKWDTARRINTAHKIVNDTFDSVMEDAEVTALHDGAALERSRAQALAIVESWVVVQGPESIPGKVLHLEWNKRAAANECDRHPGMKSRMAGKIDAIVEIDKKLYIVDHKTRYSLRDISEFLVSLPLNHQVLWYGILAKEWIREILPRRKNAEVAGFVFNFFAKPQHRSGATVDELRGRMTTAMMEEPDKYFFLDKVEFSPTALLNAERNFTRIVNNLDRLGTPGYPVYMDTTRCDDYGGCPYRTLCKAGADANDPAAVLALPEVELYSIGEIHAELSEEEEVV